MKSCDFLGWYGYIIGYWAGDYFQALRHIIMPAALMVRQQSSSIITPEWEYSQSQKSKSALLSILPHVPYIHTENWNCITLLLPGAYR